MASLTIGAMANVNQSELGLLAQTDPDAAAHRIFDAHAAHPARSAIAQELGVSSYTLRMWETRLGKTKLYHSADKKVKLPDGTPLENGLPLGEAIARVRTYHADPGSKGRTMAEADILRARAMLVALIEHMEVARQGGKPPAGVSLPENLTKLGEALSLDKSRLSRFAHGRGDLPPAKLRALLAYLEQIFPSTQPASHSLTPPAVPELPL